MANINLKNYQPPQGYNKQTLTKNEATMFVADKTNILYVNSRPQPCSYCGAAFHSRLDCPKLIPPAGVQPRPHVWTSLQDLAASEKRRGRRIERAIALVAAVLVSLVLSWGVYKILVEWVAGE